jgi:hypothetical protein
MHIAALVLSKHYSIQGTDPSIWERIRPFGNGSVHLGKDPSIWERIRPFGNGSVHLGTDPSIWERIRPFRNESRHAGTDPLLNARILSKMSESVTKCPVLYIMFQWYGGQGWNFIREGLQVRYTLWGEAMLFFLFTKWGSGRGRGS